jgi:hypothetical protein
MPLVVFYKHVEKLSLLMPRKTRFGSNFIIMDMLLQVKIALQQSIVDPQWVTYVTKLQDTRTMKALTISWKV